MFTNTLTYYSKNISSKIYINYYTRAYTRVYLVIQRNQYCQRKNVYVCVYTYIHIHIQYKLYL